MPPAVLVERALGPLDALRLLAFRLALRVPALSTIVARRDYRLATQLVMHASAAFLLAVFLPVPLFILGPVCLGVLHVASDVRYLVLRPALAPWWRRGIVVACLLFVSLHALARWHWIRVSDSADFALVTVWAVVGVGAAGLRSRARKRIGIGLALALGTGAVALLWPHAFRLFFVHAHNLVALAIWPLFYRQRPKALLALVVPILASAALLASGAFYDVSLASSGGSAFGLHLLQVASWIAPVARVDLAIGLTSAFVFLQAIHYAVWLTVIPQGAQPGQGTLSFQRSTRAALADFGGVGSLLVAVAVLSIAVGACFNAPRASATYLSLAMFHGYLEVVLLLYWWVSGERPEGAPAARRTRGR